MHFDVIEKFEVGYYIPTFLDLRIVFFGAKKVYMLDIRF